jgi:hypothetical protein
LFDRSCSIPAVSNPVGIGSVGSRPRIWRVPWTVSSGAANLVRLRIDDVFADGRVRDSARLMANPSTIGTSSACGQRHRLSSIERGGAMIMFGAALVVLYLVFWLGIPLWQVSSPKRRSIVTWQSSKGACSRRRRLRHLPPACARGPKLTMTGQCTCQSHEFPPTVTHLPGAPEFKGTSRKANAYYKKGIKWLWLRPTRFSAGSLRPGT